MLGIHPAPNLKEASVFLRLIEKIRLSDQESLESKFQSMGNQISWNLPSNGYGNKRIEIEDSEANSLTLCIEQASPIRVNDATWLQELVDSLKGGANLNGSGNKNTI
jgi:hypothetical protein